MKIIIDNIPNEDGKIKNGSIMIQEIQSVQDLDAAIKHIRQMQSKFKPVDAPAPSTSQLPLKSLTDYKMHSEMKKLVSKLEAFLNVDLALTGSYALYMFDFPFISLENSDIDITMSLQSFIKCREDLKKLHDLCGKPKKHTCFDIPEKSTIPKYICSMDSLILGKKIDFFVNDEKTFILDGLRLNSPAKIFDAKKSYSRQKDADFFEKMGQYYDIGIGDIRDDGYSDDEGDQIINHQTEPLNNAIEEIVKNKFDKESKFNCPR